MAVRAGRPPLRSVLHGRSAQAPEVHSRDRAALPERAVEPIPSRPGGGRRTARIQPRRRNDGQAGPGAG